MVVAGLTAAAFVRSVPVSTRRFARSRRILFSISTTGSACRKSSVRSVRSAASACVSSPTAKYAFCSRAHRSQKGTPQIFTIAGRVQGWSVSLRTRHGPSSVVASVLNRSSLPRRGHNLIKQPITRRAAPTFSYFGTPTGQSIPVWRFFSCSWGYVRDEREARTVCEPLLADLAALLSSRLLMGTVCRATIGGTRDSSIRAAWFQGGDHKGAL